MGTNCAPFLANLDCFSYELAFLRSLVHSPQARKPGSREYRLTRGMHETSRYIDDLPTLNFPEFEQVMYRRVDEIDAPPGSGIVLSGIYPRGFRQSQANTDDDLQASQATTEPSSSQAPDSQQAEGLVLERVQPKPGSHDVSTDQVDCLDITIKQDKHGWHCELYGKKDAMPRQAGRRRAPNIGTELSVQCKYGVIQIQMHRFSRRLRRSPLFCKATGQLLANLIQHGYNRVDLSVKVKQLSAPFMPQPNAPSGAGHSHSDGKRRRLLNQIRHWQEHFLLQDQ